MGKPIHIVMTPTRNEAWVIRAFLECNGLWADYIIIADQMSTDGTREIIGEYIAKSQELRGKSEEVRVKSEECYLRAEIILIDNKNPEFNEAERQSMLVAKAREVAAGRDTLLWGLDVDEILPANWQDTEDGKHILNSVKGDVFWFQWANLAPDKLHYGDATPQPWLFHDDGVEPHGNYVRNMHSMRIPYPIEEKQMYYVKDFPVLHCGFLSIRRMEAKSRFYQFVDRELNHRSPISLSRTYMCHYKPNLYAKYVLDIEPQWLKFPFDFWNLINLDEKFTWYEDYVVERVRKNPNDIYRLDMWDADFITRYQLSDKRRLIDRLIHAYLRKTDRYKKKNVIKAADKILKMIY